MAWTAPRTWVAGETVTAAIMNTHVRDNLKAIGDAWAAYTTVWSTTSNPQPAIGNGSLSAVKLEAGKLTKFRTTWQSGSTTTYGTGAFLFTAPSTPVTFNMGIGWGFFHDVSAPSVRVHAMYLQSATGHLACQNDAGSSVSATVPFTFANGDVQRWHGGYEAA